MAISSIGQRFQVFCDSCDKEGPTFDMPWHIEAGAREYLDVAEAAQKQTKWHAVSRVVYLKLPPGIKIYCPECWEERPLEEFEVVLGTYKHSKTP